jgi:hypothetical protein
MRREKGDRRQEKGMQTGEERMKKEGKGRRREEGERKQEKKDTD